MNDEKFPRTIYLINSDIETPWSDARLSADGSDVEYIRADIAKEREAKLIKVAYERGTLTFESLTYDSLFDEDIYKEAGLEG